MPAMWSADKGWHDGPNSKASVVNGRIHFDHCIDRDMGPCHGEVFEHSSRSGATQSFRCEKHYDEWNQRMDKVHADISSRYPGYDVPGSPPPADFDPTYAGERWDDDY